MPQSLFEVEETTYYTRSNMNNSTEIVERDLDTSIVEKVIMEGDLSQLSSEQRISYYHGLCDTLGLNAMTKPFDYLDLKGKLVLYANKSCAQQLVAKYGISLEIRNTEQVGSAYLVTCRATRATNRGEHFVDAIGAVPLPNNKTGDDYVNALMKAQTKAHRRATLSLVGLGMLDETEIETIPNASRAVVDSSTGEIVSSLPPAKSNSNTVMIPSNDDTEESIPEHLRPFFYCQEHETEWEERINKMSGKPFYSHNYKDSKDKSQWCNANKVFGDLIKDYCKTNQVEAPTYGQWTEVERAEWLHKNTTDKSFGHEDFDKWLSDNEKNRDDAKEVFGLAEGIRMQTYLDAQNITWLDAAKQAAEYWEIQPPTTS